MSISLVACLFGIILFLISQFGGKLTAKNALIWWLIFVFLLCVTLDPTRWIPVAHFLGVSLVSNLIFAAMILFLVCQAIQESVVSTGQSRQLRNLVTQIASKQFLQKQIQSVKSTQTRVLVVFPCYNEEANLQFLLKEIDQLLQNQEYQFLPCIVNDGSVDQTELILEQNQEHTPYWVSHSINVGVSGVLLTGFKIARRLNVDYVVQCDADGQHPVQEIPKLIKTALVSKTDLLIGSRYINSKWNEAHLSSTRSRKLGSYFIRIALKLFSWRVTITDPTSGFRVYSQRAVELLEKQMPDEYPEPETIALFLAKGMKMGESLVAMRPRQGGVSSISSASFMFKVVSALLGLRLRTCFWNRNDR